MTTTEQQPFTVGQDVAIFSGVYRGITGVVDAVEFYEDGYLVTVDSGSAKYVEDHENVMDATDDAA
jgi:hypothetical protein